MPYCKEKRKLYDRERILTFNKFVKDYKKDKCCEECGYNKVPQILSFHHKTAKDKLTDISKIKRSKNIFYKEIKKCVLLCPNCHMEKHV